MPNHLAIPFKVTYDVDIKEPTRQFLSDYTDVHPEEFKSDINQWQLLRKTAVGGTVVSLDRADAAIRYNAQLAFILTKLPLNIGLRIPYAPAFKPSGLPISLNNIAYERCSVLFNLAALYSQLANSQDRSTDEGIKRTKGYCESAAGTLSYLTSTALPQLIYDPADEEIALDLSPSFVKSLEWLMLAQAQECAWQLATINGHLYKNGLLARLAAQAAALYEYSLNSIRNGSSAIKHLFPKSWLAHLETKQFHFQAVSQFRRSLDDIEASRYGHEIARLYVSRTDAKKGYDLARNGGVASAVVQDIQSLLDTLQKNIARAERDNDLIYHKEVPNASELPAMNLKGAMLCSIKVPSGLTNPDAILSNDEMIFGELLGWGAREAINIYNHNKQILLKDQIADVATDFDDKMEQTLRDLNLPASLEALEKPIGLPLSLLRKAEEVRLEDGVARVETSIENVQKLAEQVSTILNEAMDILDAEASEDESFRSEHSAQRKSSHIANKDLIKKAQRYTGILEQARESDAVVRSKWDEWEKNISDLTLDEAQLEASVPSSANSTATISGAQTKRHARSLHVLLESMDDLRRQRSQLVDRARRLADGDDVRQSITKKSTGFEQFTEVRPAMFEDISDAEMAKYDKFVRGVRETGEKQEAMLDEVRTQNELFLQSRRQDPSLKEREHALQSLDLAYHKYREITRNLDEGIKFYNELSKMMTDFKNHCTTWSRNRKLELRSLTQNMQEMSLGYSNEDHITSSLPPASEVSTVELEIVGALPPSPPPRPSKKLTFESDDWEDLQLPPAPSMKTPVSKAKSSKKRLAQPQT